MDGEIVIVFGSKAMYRQMAVDQQQRLMEALTLTAGREKGAGMGGFVYQLAQQVSALNQWLRDCDNGRCIPIEWAAVTDEAGFVWSEWYDWYTRFYTRRNDTLDDLSIDDLVELGGLEKIGLMLQEIEAERKAS